MKGSALLRGLISAGNILVFAVVFALSCWGIRQVLPFPEVPVVQAKLAHLAERVNDYDTLFIGSSRIYHQIVPALFDQLMAEKGMPTRSFNAGVDGMRPPEDAYVLDRIFSLRPKRLRYVFVELAALRLAVDEDKRGTLRSEYWHDWERLSLVFRRAVFQKKKRGFWDRLQELREPLDDFADHFDLFLRNWANMGRSEVLMECLRPKTPPPDTAGAIGERADGFVVANFPQDMPPDVRADFDKELTERRSKPAVRDLADPVSQDALAKMVAKINNLGATPVLIVPPTTNKKNFAPAQEVANKTLVFDFSDLQRFPALFENRHRQDTDHVNAAGAELFTRLLVDEFTRDIASHK